jgi:hypothetical protein
MLSGFMTIFFVMFRLPGVLHGRRVPHARNSFEVLEAPTGKREKKKVGFVYAEFGSTTPSWKCKKKKQASESSSEV